MNSNINDKQIKSTDGQVKNHQAFAMELSRIGEAKKMCEETKNCFEYNRLGGQKRKIELESIVQSERKRDEMRRKTQMDTNPENMHQDEKKPTDVGVTKVTKSADHSGGEVKKILSNSQALSEEISNMKYLIEYMNNNKKQKL
jgi:hypothetical protein